MNLLAENGLLIGDTQFDTSVKYIIADTSAWAFLKNTVGHVAKYLCERCTVKGIKVDGSTVSNFVNAEERTNDSFRNFDQPELNHAPSALLRLIPFIKMIAFFVLDFMHLCCQGIRKKMIAY